MEETSDDGSSYNGKNNQTSFFHKLNDTNIDLID